MTGKVTTQSFCADTAGRLPADPRSRWLPRPGRRRRTRSWRILDLDSWCNSLLGRALARCTPFDVLTSAHLHSGGFPGQGTATAATVRVAAGRSTQRCRKSWDILHRPVLVLSILLATSTHEQLPSPWLVICGHSGSTANPFTRMYLPPCMNLCASLWMGNPSAGTATLNVLDLHQA